MRVYLERFVIPMGVVLVGAVITGQLRFTLAYRIGTGVAAALATYFAASLAEKQDPRESGLPSKLPGPSARKILGLIVSIALVALFVIGGFRSLRAKESQRSRTELQPERTPVEKPPAKPVAPKTAPGDRQPTSVTSQQDAFVQKHLVKDTGTRGSGLRWAFLIAGGNQSSFPELDSAAAGVLWERGYQRVSIFRPSLIQEGRFGELYAADPVLIHKLNQYCDGVIVGKISSALRTNTAPEGLFTAELSLEMRVISTQSGGMMSEFRIQENGAGFTPAEAQAHAEERLAKHLKEQLRDKMQ